MPGYLPYRADLLWWRDSTALAGLAPDLNSTPNSPLRTLNPSCHGARRRQHRTKNRFHANNPNKAAP
jgi:hypothetical protein